MPGDRATHATFLVLFAALLVLPFLFHWDPSQPSSLSLWGCSLPPTCPSQALFGVTCPGCGVTRAFVALVHLDIQGSLRLHSLGVLLYLFLAARAILQAWLLLVPEAASRVGIARLYHCPAWLMVVLLLVNWVIRLGTG